MGDIVLQLLYFGASDHGCQLLNLFRHTQDALLYDPTLHFGFFFKPAVSFEHYIGVLIECLDGGRELVVGVVPLPLHVRQLVREPMKVFLHLQNPELVDLFHCGLAF